MPVISIKLIFTIYGLDDPFNTTTQFNNRRKVK